MLDGTEYIECRCYSPEHAMVFTLDLEDNIIYTYVFLDQYQPFWKRIWIAVKYVFGYKCIYGHFDEFIMRPQDAHKLSLMLKALDWQPFGHEGFEPCEDS